MRRVAITGMGAISAAGEGVEALWRAARDGVSAVGPLDIARGEKLRVRIVAAVRDFEPERHLSAADLRRCDRFAQFAHVAAAEAVASAGLAAGEIAGARTAAIVGTGVGGIGTLDDGCFHFYTGTGRLEVMSVPRVMPSSAASHVSIAHGITGPCFGVTSACSSASQSIGVGAMLVRAGVVDRAIVGGSEACITPATLRAWEMLRVLTPDACRPFSADRSGMVIGEGAAAFVLEADEAAAARGVRPLAWLAGYGTTSDARDFLQPDVDGAAGAMAAALADAGLPAAAIGYVNAHGTGTVLNDINEAAALRRVFGDALDDVPVSSTKPVIGHALGASGALELAVTVRALVEQTVPPHINFTAPDPKCALNLPTGGAVKRRFDAALSNSFAFGGINAALVVTRAEDGA